MKGINEHHNQLNHGKPIATNNKNLEQLDKTSQAQTQRTSTSKSSNRDYSNHETENAQFEQVQGRSSGLNNNFDHQYIENEAQPTESEVINMSSSKTEKATAHKSHGNTDGYEQGYASNEGSRQLKDMNPSPQMRNSNQNEQRKNELNINGASIEAHEGYHQTK